MLLRGRVVVGEYRSDRKAQEIRGDAGLCRPKRFRRSVQTRNAMRHAGSEWPQVGRLYSLRRTATPRPTTSSAAKSTSNRRPRGSSITATTPTGARFPVPIGVGPAGLRRGLWSASAGSGEARGARCAGYRPHGLTTTDRLRVSTRCAPRVTGAVRRAVTTVGLLPSVRAHHANAGCAEPPPTLRDDPAGNSPARPLVVVADIPCRLAAPRGRPA